MFTNNKININLHDKRVEMLLSAYLSFRETGCSYAEAVSVSMQGCISEASADTTLLDYGVRCIEKMFKPYFDSLFATDKFNMLMKIRAQIRTNEHKVAQLAALAQLNACLDLIDWSHIDTTLLASLESDRDYTASLIMGNPYVILVHATLLTQLNEASAEKNKLYFLEQFANLKIYSDRIGYEHGMLGCYVKAMINHLYAQYLSLDNKVVSSLLSVTQNELQEMANHLSEMSLIDEMILTGRARC
jgi:hypothetical protein